MRRYGFSEYQRQSILRKIPNIRHATLTTDMNFLLSKAGKIVEIKFFDALAHRGWLVYRNGSKFNATEFTPQFQIQRKRLSGKVSGSVYASIFEKTNSHWVASRFVDAYSLGADRNLSVQRGAHFNLVLEKKYIDGKFVKFGEVLETKISNQGRQNEKSFVKIGRGGIFINEKDLELKRPFYAPVDYLRISSQFQPNRRHPITKRVQPHLGVDFELPIGEPVYAAKSGTIVRYGYHHAAGNYVVILHPGGHESSYNHMQSINRNLRIGMRVSGGQKIGTIGCTGYCTKAHLHFALRLKGRMVNPINYINPYPVFAKNKLENHLAAN